MGWRADLGQHPAFVRLVVARFAFLLGTFAIGRFFVLLVADRLGSDAASAAVVSGELLALFTLATAAAGLCFGWAADRLGRGRVMAVGAAISGAAVLALLADTGLAPVVVAGVGMAVGSGAFIAANWAATTDALPAGRHGQFMGLANFGTAGAAAAAGLFGPLVDLGGRGGGDGFAILIVGAAAAILLALLPLRGLRLSARSDTQATDHVSVPATAS